jgi:DNA-binding transcriptional LysR family regulator
MSEHRVLSFKPQLRLECRCQDGVLPDCPPSPTPVSLLYPRDRQLSPRVRVFIDWLMRVFDAARDTGHDRGVTGVARTRY